MSCRATSTASSCTKDDVPLFSRFQIEHQIETAFSAPSPCRPAAPSSSTTPKRWCRWTSTRRARHQSDIETTALNTNLEAADEIARQLRLRDLGGLIVIDFIDMETRKTSAKWKPPARSAEKPTAPACKWASCRALACWSCRASACNPALAKAATCRAALHGTGFIRGIESSACISCASFRKRR